MTGDANSKAIGNIEKLLYTKDTRRVYELSDGSFEERSGGSASWRHNNPGNLKFEYAHSADSTVHTKRTKEHALESAKSKYDGVVDLDQRGNAIFNSVENGRAAQIKVIKSHGDNKTVAQMLGDYSKPDYSGPTHHKQQEDMIYRTGEAAGVDLRTKKVSEMSDKEISALADGISKFEGWQKGEVHALTEKQVGELLAGQKDKDVTYNITNPGNNTSHNQPATDRVFHQGDHGSEVKNIQSELKHLGYFHDEPDGKFGPITKAAVESFQQARGITPDGKVGSTTQQHLEDAKQQKASLAAPEAKSHLLVFSDSNHPQNPLYNSIKERFPSETKPEWLACATAKCYMAGIKDPDELGNIYGNGKEVIFTTNSPLASNAKMDTTQSPLTVQQTMQQVQQYDQQQAQIMTQTQAQNAQQTPQGPIQGGQSY